MFEVVISILITFAGLLLSMEIESWEGCGKGLIGRYLEGKRDRKKYSYKQ